MRMYPHLRAFVWILNLLLFDPAHTFAANFVLVSNYFVANVLGAMITILVGALFWIVIVVFTRPKLFEALDAFVGQASSAVSLFLCFTRCFSLSFNNSCRQFEEHCSALC
jgi:hypothetical protein